MIYTSCQAACPRLVADMRNIKKKVNNAQVHYLLMSIDPVNDTLSRLKEYKTEEELDGDQWILLNGEIDDVRELSNVLSMKYKKISPFDFAHTNIISVLDQNGELKFQQEGLGMDNAELVSEVQKLLN